jgi:hypothetical protein
MERFALLIALAAICLAATFTSTSVKAQDTNEAEIEAFAEDLVAAFNAGDPEAFADMFTDEGLIAFMDDPSITTREEAIAALPEFGLGELMAELVEVRDIQVNGESGSAVIHLQFPNEGFETIDRITVTRVGGVLLVSNYESGVEQPPPPEIPAGYEVIPVSMVNYGFIVDTGPIAIGDRIAFEATNNGTEPHELIFLRVPAGLDLEEALESEEPPPGVEDLAFTFAEPGQFGRAIVEDPMTAGRYVMVCFVETEQGVPHWQLGMLREFTLQAATPTPSPPAPTAPATGSGTSSGGAWPLGVMVMVLTAAAFTAAGAIAVSQVRAR